jgi:hypothetical protein
MATTISSTALDFNNIKNNLKTYLAAQDEFRDYNFEAAGLSNILDVLAYNTHMNGLIANFATNESFLGTAQLRSSVVSLAEGIGYIPDSKMASTAYVNLSVNLSSVPNRPTIVTLPSASKFTAPVDDISYTFQTIEAYSAVDNGDGIYYFTDINASRNIPIYEGIFKSKTFYVGEYNENDVYIIPDENIDVNTAIVRVYSAVNSNSSILYENIINAVSLSASSTYYSIKESPNNLFELSFGDGVNLGVAPVAGNKIVVTYISTSGSVANGAIRFTPANGITINGTSYNVATTTASPSVGGDNKESIESIRKNAPYQYAAQNRMVTAEDYTAIILRKYSQFITDIKSWGGEDNLEPKFGTIFTSILFENDVSETLKTSIKTEISELVGQLGIISFKIEYADPIETHIETSIYFQINPKLTSLSLNTIEKSVTEVVTSYFSNTIGEFNRSFRRSNLLSLIDDISPAILSSRADIQLQQRFIPIIGRNFNYNLRFPVAIAAPDNDAYSVTSATFTYGTTICKIQNKLGTTTLQIVSASTGEVIVDAVGQYVPTTGVVNIVGFNPNTVIGGVSYIKLSVVPANPSAVAPQRNDVLRYDSEKSFATPVLVTATN